MRTAGEGSDCGRRVDSVVARDINGVAAVFGWIDHCKARGTPGRGSNVGDGRSTKQSRLYKRRDRAKLELIRNADGL
jgi:hypothetical protein